MRMTDEGYYLGAHIHNTKQSQHKTWDTTTSIRTNYVKSLYKSKDLANRKHALVAAMSEPYAKPNNLPSHNKSALELY